MGGESHGLAWVHDYIWRREALARSYGVPRHAALQPYVIPPAPYHTHALQPAPLSHPVGATNTMTKGKSAIGRDATSKISPWLAHGCVSPRRLFHEVDRLTLTLTPTLTPTPTPTPTSALALALASALTLTLSASPQGARGGAGGRARLRGVGALASPWRQGDHARGRVGRATAVFGVRANLPNAASHVGGSRWGPSTNPNPNLRLTLAPTPALTLAPTQALTLAQAQAQTQAL